MEKIRGALRSPKWTRMPIYAICFTGVLIFLSRYDNFKSETEKSIQSCIAYLFLLVIIMAMQKIELFNLHSLIVTVAFFPIAFFRSYAYRLSTDLLPSSILSDVTLWLALLVIADMAATKRVRLFRSIRWPVFLIYMVAITLITLFSNSPGLSAFFYLLIICFIPIDEKDWKEMIDGLLIAGFISFVYIVIASFVTNPFFGVSEEAFMEKNPHQHGRWYGCFLNIGAFGQYLGLSTAMAIGSIYRCKDIKKKIVPLIVSWIWLAASIFMAALNGTRNYMVAVALLLVILFIFGWRKATKKGVLIRLSIAATLLILAIVGVTAFGKYVISPEYNPEKVTQLIQKSPLGFASAGLKHTLQELNNVHNGGFAGYDGRNIFPEKSVWRFFNAVSSNRVGIGRVFLENTNWKTGQTAGIQYGGYFAYNAHNQYIQSLYEYGFLAGAVYLLYAITSWIMIVFNAVKQKKTHLFISMVIITMMMGMWLGERSTITYPLTFVGLLLNVSMLVSINKDMGFADNSREGVTSE